MSFKFTAPETQDVETLKTLCDLVEAFGEAATDIAVDAGLAMTPEMETEGEGLMKDLIPDLMGGNEAAETLATLRVFDFGLRTAFESVAAVEGAQEKMLTFVPQALGSEVNAGLIEKYELTGLATLVQKAKSPDFL